MKAFYNKNSKAIDCMLQYGIIKSRSEVKELLQTMSLNKNAVDDSQKLQGSEGAMVEGDSINNIL